MLNGSFATPLGPHLSLAVFVDLDMHDVGAAADRAIPTYCWLMPAERSIGRRFLRRTHHRCNWLRLASIIKMSERIRDIKGVPGFTISFDPPASFFSSRFRHQIRDWLDPPERRML